MFYYNKSNIKIFCINLCFYCYYLNFYYYILYDVLFIKFSFENINIFKFE